VIADFGNVELAERIQLANKLGHLGSMDVRCKPPMTFCISFLHKGTPNKAVAISRKLALINTGINDCNFNGINSRRLLACRLAISVGLDETAQLSYGLRTIRDQ
jgi:hypothetical protein